MMRTKHRKFPICLWLALLVLVVNAAPSSAQMTIRNLTTDGSSFSPNGDLRQDSLTIRYEFADTATTVSLQILTKDSSTVINTLVSGPRHNPDSVFVFVWDGKSSGGSTVPDDTFLVFLGASGPSGPDAAYRRIFVDTVSPLSIITNLFPFQFAPGSPDPSQPTRVFIEYYVSDGLSTDELFVNGIVVAPDAEIIATFVDSLLTPDNSYIGNWNGDEATLEGLHRIEVHVTDQAGNTSFASATFDVDLMSPRTTITSPPGNSHVQVPPDSLFGFSVDRSGIDSLLVQFSASGPFQMVTPTSVFMDTTFFSVSLTDSVSAERVYTLVIRAIDNVGRDRETQYNITVDTTGPGAPTVDKPPSPVQSSTVTLTGTHTTDSVVLRFMRTGTVLDSFFTSGTDFEQAVPLIPGTNRLVVVGVDRAGNVGAQSNEVTVVFDASAKLGISQPFHPDDKFNINLTKVARSVTLRIYDLGGDLAAELRDTSPSKTISISWTGQNGDFVTVKKGPLVAVVEVHYADGDKEIFREVFLFQP